VHSIGLASNFQSGFLHGFNLHHEGALCSSAGYPYYSSKQVRLRVADSFLAGLISFCYLLAPEAFTLVKSFQDQLEVEQRLSPFEFLEQVLEHPQWPSQELKVAVELRELVLKPKLESLHTEEGRKKVLNYFRYMSSTINSDYDGDTLHQYFPDDPEVRRFGNYKGLPLLPAVLA
jgi:hypothetical protein